MPTATIVLKRDNHLDIHSLPGKLTREAFKPFTVACKKVDAVISRAFFHGLKVLEVKAERRTVRVEGDLESIQSLAEDHNEDIEIVLWGLRQIAQPRMRIIAHAASQSYTAAQVAAKYNFPPGGGDGQTVALIELGGSYSGSGVKIVSVDGAVQQSGDADGEVALDIAVVQGAAPKAGIVVYFTQNTDAGFYDAISTALHATPTPCAISISWGGPEDQWDAKTMEAFDNLFQSCVAMGVMVTVAAGDAGSGDGESGQHVDFPASSPHVLACGGTRFGNPETVWDDANDSATGGGFSTVFPRPSYQEHAHVHANRGVPDVAGDADPDTGYEVTVDGQPQVIGGTSAVAPLWAALTALYAQANPKLGNFQALLYQSADGFNDITQGNNGAEKATKHWDACTGLGTPKGAVLLEMLTKLAG